VSELASIERKIDELRGDFLPRSAVVAMFRALSADMHTPSSRGCATCRAVTALIAEPFGCDAFAARKRSSGDQR
jgi:hypothetical protein